MIRQSGEFWNVQKPLGVPGECRIGQFLLESLEGASIDTPD
jgi:hypothetical protein